MADYSITAGSVKPVPSGTTGATTTSVKTAGETITAGQSLYQKSSDNKYYKADANGSAEERIFAGIALNGAAADQPVVVATGGDLDIGTTGLVADTVILSATAGGIAPIADLAAGWYLNYVGYFITTTRIRLMNISTGYVKA